MRIWVPVQLWDVTCNIGWFANAVYDVCELGGQKEKAENASMRVLNKFQSSSGCVGMLVVGMWAAAGRLVQSGMCYMRRVPG